MLVPQPGIEPTSLALEEILNYWTTREVPDEINILNLWTLSKVDSLPLYEWAPSKHLKALTEQKLTFPEQAGILQTNCFRMLSLSLQPAGLPQQILDSLFPQSL